MNHLLGSDRNPGASHLDRQRLIGLALSGGGIRAASFSLGVLQAMANADRLKHVHYMSTVSGGGFIGSSLSWFIGHGACRNHPDATAADGRFEAASAYFPFGAKEHAELVTRDDSSRREDERAAIDDEADDSERLRHQAAWTNAREKRAQQTRILSHIRQNGSYLNPRGGWDIIILFATMLRFLIPSFFVYFCALLLPIAFIAYLLALGPISDRSLLHPSEDLADSGHYSRIIDSNPPNAPSSLSDASVWLHYNGAWRIGGALLLTFTLAALVYALFSGTPKTLTWSRSLLRSFVVFPLCLLVVFPPILFALLFYISQPLDIYITASLIISIIAASISYSHFVGPLILFLLNFPLIVSLDKNIFNYHDEGNLLATIYYFELAIAPLLYVIGARIFIFFKQDKSPKFKLLDLSLYISGSFIVFLALIYGFDVTSLPVNTDDTAQILWISGILGALSIVVIIICLQRQATDSDDADILQDAYAIRQRARLPGAFILIFAGAFLVAGLLPVLYADVSSTIGPALTATGIAAYLGKVFVDISDIKKTFAGFEGLLIVVACFGTVIGLLLLGFALCDLIYEAHRALGFEPTDLRESLALIVVLTALFGAAVGWQANANFVGFHRFYRDRLMQTFFPSPYRMEDTDYQAKHVEGFFVHQLRHASRAGERRGPYHLINTNLVLTSSANARYRGRGGANFIISPLYSGSDATGWRATESWRMPTGSLTLATAMAVSGAAINPQTGPSGRGPMRTPFVSFLMTLFNARLGLWLPNPDPAVKQPSHAPNLLNPGIDQGLGGRFHREDRGFIELTDGGHFDNTGLYELIRRNVKLIIMVDGSDDNEFHCSDLASAFERIRADFGVQIRFGDDEPILKKLMHDPDKKDAYAKKLKTAEEGFAIARIDYQPHNQPHNQHPSGKNPEDGYLVIIKATMVDDLPVDVLGYKSANPHFPNETTADQFFDEIQLEAYRELGYRLGKAAMGHDIVKREFAHCITGRNGENAGQKP
ncbi:MAG: patatin-like phospholipase family protein [Alphaproteobacteria bacterium]